MTIDPGTTMLILPPYALALGMEIDRIENGVPILAYDFSDKVIGRPDFIHGGALSGLLEIAGIIAVRAKLSQSHRAAKLKPVNITVDFMRGGRSHRTFAMGKVTRLGRRVANVEIAAWQEDREKWIASAHINLLLG